MTHTPTPWETWNDDTVQQTETMHVVAEIRTSYTGMPGKENSEFIVRACNAHEKLVEALEGMVYYALFNEGWQDEHPGYVIAAKEALQLARGE